MHSPTFRNIPYLFKLVPGMYVSYYKSSQTIVAHHGATDQFSGRMQVLIDVRSVYMPPNNTVDWAGLPTTIDDQPQQHRMGVRIARAFGSAAGIKGGGSWGN